MQATVVRRLAALVIILVPFAASAQTPTPAGTARPAAAATPKPLATPTAEPEAMPTPEAADDETVAENNEKPFKPKISGFLITRYDVTDGKGAEFSAENSYSIPAARINFDGQVHPLLRYHAAVDLAERSVFSYGAQTVATLKDAYIDYDPTKMLKVRAGQFRKPIGYEVRKDENEIIPIRRSRLTHVLAGEDVRDTGVALFLNLGKLGWALAVTNGTPAGRAEFDDHKTVLSRGAFLLAGDAFSFDFGVSGQAGQEHSHAHGDNITIGQGGSEATFQYWNTSYDVEVNAGPIVVVSEAVYGKTTWINASTGAGVYTVDNGAIYVLVGYKLAKMTPWTRFEYRELSFGNSDASNPLGGIGGVPTQNPGEPQWTNAITIGLNWRLVKDHAKLRTEYTARSGFSTVFENIVTAGGPPTGVAGYTDEISHSFAASLEVDF